MRSQRPIGLHLVLDDESVYNNDYRTLQFALGLRYGWSLLSEARNKLPPDLIDEILAEFANDQMKINIEAEQKELARVEERRDELDDALSNISMKHLDDAFNFVNKKFQREYDAGLVGLPARLPVTLQAALFMKANPGLLENIRKELTQGAEVFVANASLRQYPQYNKQRMLMHDTGCLFTDLQSLVSHLQKEDSRFERAAWLDPLTMSDVGQHKKEGDHFKYAVNECMHLPYDPEIKSVVATIYLHAHYIAEQHPEADIAIHCYHGNLADCSMLKQLFIDHHTLLPPGAHVLFHHYQGSIRSTQTALGNAPVVDAQYRNNTLALNQVLHAIHDEKKEDKGRHRFQSFVEERDLAMVASSDKHIAFLLDADNCLYNRHYYFLLNVIVDKFGDTLLSIKRKTVDSEDVTALSEEIMRTINDYPEELLHDEDLSYETIMSQWRSFVVKYEKLEIDCDISSMQASQPEKDLKHGHILHQFIRHIDQCAPQAMTEIIFRANKHMLDDMLHRITHYGANKAVLMIGSLRQSARSDFFNSVWNGSGLFFTDMMKMVDRLNAHCQPLSIQFKFDRLTLVDCLYKLGAGTHHQLREHPTHKELSSVSDIEKVRIMYIACHHLARVYDVIDTIFYDDSPKVIMSIYNAYHANDKHALLPKGRNLHLIEYDGFFVEGDCYTITGRGEVDLHPHYFIRSTLQGPDASLDSDILAIYAAHRLRVTPERMHTFARVTGWMSRKACHAEPVMPAADNADDKTQTNSTANL